MKEPTPAQKQIYDRVAALKNPQCAEDISRHFAITHSCASLHLRSLYNIGLLEVAMKVRSKIYYRKKDLLAPSEIKFEPVRRTLIKMPKAANPVADTKTKRARAASVILQDVWSSVVSR